MLVLSRKLNEAFKIGNDITVEVVAIYGDRVRIGITAPTDVHVVRDNAVSTVPKAYAAEMRVLDDAAAKAIKEAW